MSQTLVSTDFAAYLDDWNAARAVREQQRRDVNGYISYAGFHKLETRPTRFDSIPGVWTTGPDGPRVELADGDALVVDGQRISGSHQFAPVREREFRRVAQSGDVIIELSRRGGQDLLRPIDPAFGRRLVDRFDHTPTYEPDARWIVQGHFAPFEAIRTTAFAATLGGIVHQHATVGEVVLDLDGVEQRLLIMTADDHQAGTPGSGTVLFTDATSGITTDPLGRSTPVDFPAEAGPVTLDFNYARNIQRPYTAFAPCPVAPAQNRVTTAVEAGEQLPIFAD